MARAAGNGVVQVTQKIDQINREHNITGKAQEAANALFDEAVLLRNADGGSAAMINAEEV